MNYSEIETELKEAQVKYGYFNSTHEVYAVLKEEVEEFWDVVKEKNLSGADKTPEGLSKKEGMVKELIQVAAIAIRAIDELENNEIRWI